MNNARRDYIQCAWSLSRANRISIRRQMWKARSIFLSRKSIQKRHAGRKMEQTADGTGYGVYFTDALDRACHINLPVGSFENAFDIIGIEPSAILERFQVIGIVKS